MVTLVNTLTVTGDPAEFEAVTENLTAYMRQQPGYLRYQLLRSIRRANVYVEIAHWTDADSHRQAVQSAGFRSRVEPLGAIATVDPDMYELVREGEAGQD
ncbi:antibiotic biosynthesis monooxygenase family protein [Nocardia arthritidis]|uniref:Antibiotic biosynthesis monooxygenase n=1 Tax=Nocardia arthritidis TaxID=228602 RepID=A0A6G9YA54_9NOCA|nr:antibiotic biosynthesis monooxygenase family protein [Nocardia arthritidis]QIS10034.1 antibiotic biosynthesis monooxygenase [Nocardia arthritidis]